MKAESTLSADTVSYTGLVGNYTDNNYVNSHLIPSSKFTYSGTQGMIKYPLSNAFDGNSDSVYLSSIANSDTFNNTIYINFTEKVKLEAIIYEPGFNDLNDGTRVFQGCMTKLCVYGSINNGPYTLFTIFEGTPTYSMTKILFHFPQIFECDKLKLEIANLTVQTFDGDSKKPIICSLCFIHYYKTAFLTGATDKYTDDDYIYSNKVDLSYFSYDANEGINGHTLSNAFDNDISTFYISDINTISINFSQTVSIEALIYEPKYNDVGDTRFFEGFPSFIRVYKSLENSDFLLNNFFLGKPVYPWNRIQLVFPEIIECDRLKLEFDYLTNQTIIGDSKKAVICELYFIQPFFNPTTAKPTESDILTSPTIEPTDPQIPIVKPCKSDTRCGYEGSENGQILVQIETSDFSGIENSEDGGAVYLINSGLTCNKISFTDCSSKKGGGGGIYLNNCHRYCNRR